MAQVWKIRLPNGEVVRPGEWSSTPLYSTVEVNRGTQGTLKGFSYGIGGTVPGSPGPRKANISDTNMDGAGAVLAENEELLIYSLQIELFSVTANDIFDDSVDDDTGVGVFAQAIAPLVSTAVTLFLQSSVVVVMKIANTKEYARERLGFFPAGMGVNPSFNHHSSLAGFPSITNVGSNGGVSVWDNREFATPHHVAPGEAFEVGLTFPFGSVASVVGNADGGGDGNDVLATTDVYGYPWMADEITISDQLLDTDARIRARIYAAGYRKRPVA